MKTFIQNRHDKKIAVVVEETPNSKGLAFIMHGLGGFKEQPQIQTFAQAFRDSNFTVVLFDTTNTFGESDGDYMDATTTNYFEDLEDVIAWSKKESWFKQPFVLVGHSLGGISVAMYAEKHPEEILALAPIGTVVSGKLSLESPLYQGNDLLKEWERTGIRATPSDSKPGLIKKLKWSHVADRMKYNLLPEVDKLTMPVLMVVGERDTSTPYPHQKILFDELPGKKELHLIKNAPHTFLDPLHLEELKVIFDSWIKNNL